MSLGSSFSLLSALSVPCAVWQCALLLPWQGILFHRCSRNLWPNVMLPLWVNKTGQSVFRILVSLYNFYHYYKLINNKTLLETPVSNLCHWFLSIPTVCALSSDGDRQKVGRMLLLWENTSQDLGLTTSLVNRTLGSCESFVNSSHQYLRCENWRGVRIKLSEEPGFNPDTSLFYFWTKNSLLPQGRSVEIVSISAYFLGVKSASTAHMPHNGVQQK